MALGVHQNGLLPAQLDLDGAAGAVGDERRVMLNGHILLAAEAAAYQRVLHLDLFSTQQQAALVQRRVGGLVGRDEHDVAVRVLIGHAALRLEESMLCPRRIEMLRNHVLGALDRPGRIAAADVLVRLYVRRLLLKDQRRVRGGLRDVMYRREDVVGHLDQFLRLFQRLQILRDDQRNRVSQIMRHAADGDQRILVVLQVSDLVLAGDVRGGEHRHHARQLQRKRSVNSRDTGAGVPAAHGGAVAHVFHIEIIGIFAVAEYLFLHVDTLDATAELPVRGGGQGDFPLAEDLSGQTDGVDDLDIARAAAVIVADGKADLLVRGFRDLVQQALGAQHHTGNAEAALHGAGFPEGEGIRRLFKIGQALDRQNMLPVQALGVRNAGAAGLSLDQNGAGAAGALAAPVLDGRQTQLVAQIAQQLLLFCNVDFLSIDIENRHSAGPFLVDCAYNTNQMNFLTKFLDYNALYNKTLLPARQERDLFCRITGSAGKKRLKYNVKFQFCP